MLRRLTIAAFLTVLSASPALADDDDSKCKLRLDAVPSQWKISDVDLFESETAFGSFDLNLENEGSAPCSVRLTLDTLGSPFGLTGGGSGRRVGYSIYDHESGADLSPKNGRSQRQNRGVIVVPPRSQRIARFDVAVPNNFDTDGTFRQQLRIEAEGNGNSSSAQRTLTLAVDVNSSASMALSGQFTRNGSAADVDLGEISANMVRTPVMLHVRSTRAYRIDSSSQNGGKLKLAGTAWEIPYRMTIGDRTLNSDGGAYVSTAGANRRVDNLALGFAITGGINVEAGRYSDIVTLSISLI